ncbi:DNA-binding protein [Agromyces sp. NPDC056523]|uniref:DNA-binding protein n=1 Tax=Agromyces sp. NPDC056523 TaxID=3345850 RepID=UPI00366AB9B8
MFVITADQVGSRTDIDRSAAMQADLQERFGERLRLPVDQTAGDELQALTEHADAALDLVLALGRDGHWSTGLGVGEVRTPLPDAVRKAAGGAFIAAREAVDAAKRAEGRFALRAAIDPATATDASAPALEAAELEPLVRLLLLVRDRRSPQGWEAIDLVREVGSQKRAAETLGISDAAVSQRLKAAVWSIDDDARPGLVRLLADLDHAADPAEARLARTGHARGDGGDR